VGIAAVAIWVLSQGGIAGLRPATATSTKRPPATPNLEATAQAYNANATAEARNAWVQGFAQPILNDVLNRQPNFEDDFSQMSERFVRWSYLQGSVSFGDGVMHLDTTGTNWSAGGGSLIATDFVLKYEVKPVRIGSGSSVCTNFRSGDDGGYNFCVGLSDDNWGMGGFPPGGDYYTVLEGGSSGVNANRTTRLTIIARGDEFAFFVDDNPIGYIKDDSYHGSTVEIGVYTPNDIALVDVDNVQFWHLNNLLP
jgi:hypothetical protein